MEKDKIYDNGKNSLYSGWNLVKFYGLYQDDDLHNDEDITGENYNLNLVSLGGRASKINDYDKNQG